VIYRILRIAQLFRKTVPESISLVSERSIGYFETSVDCYTLKSDNMQMSERGVNLQVEKVLEI